MVALSGAGGLVGFLGEPDPHVQAFALQYIYDDIDLLWSEIAESVGQIEALFEDESFPDRELAAIIVAKIYYHLGEYDEAMVFALNAGKRFNVQQDGEFEDVVISRCVDSYIEVASRKASSTRSHSGDAAAMHLSESFSNTADGSASMSASMVTPLTPFTHSALPSRSLLSRQGTLSDEPVVHMNGGSNHDGRPIVIQRGVLKQLQSIIDGLFAQCYQKGRFRQVLGVAIEGQDLHVIEEAILEATKKAAKNPSPEDDGPQELLEYVLGICMTIIQDLRFRDELMSLVVVLLDKIPAKDYFAISKCVIYLDQPQHAAQLLADLVEKDEAGSRAVAYQLAFDLYSNSTQDFLGRIRSQATIRVKEHITSNGSATAGSAPNVDNATESQPLLADVTDHSTDHSEPPKSKAVYENIHGILQGLQSIDLEREFLFRNNHAEVKILSKIKESLDARNSIFHTALTFANAFMHSGTTVDGFFRDNLDWLGKAVNWSKFSATAALGVIHRGNLTQGMKLLDPYLPKDNSVTPGSPYSQGGSLFALGLIYANHGSEIIDFLKSKLMAAEDKVVQHGGALGIGAAGMATGSIDTYEQLRDKLYVDNAESGEALGMSMGLVMLGSANVQCLEDMIAFAHDTQHDKTIRGLAMGMAFIMFGRQEISDELTDRLLENPEPAIRYGGIMTIAMAYCGTSSNKAVRKLLHIAVSDVSDDVRRVAVMSLGFILFRKPNSVPRMVELLSESYNPHVRYGSAMALGIACAGTGLDEAVDILEPMQKDPTDFVRQGAHIALSMILIEQNETMNPKVGSIRKTFAKVVGDKHEDAMTKFGACLAMGIIDAGGRNCTIGLQTPTGNLNMPAIVGMACFTQYWYWFPFTHFLSLSFTPTAIIGLDSDLEVPDFKFHSATKPSTFDYPPNLETKAESGPTKVATAVLSTTAYAKRRAQRKERDAKAESMDVDKLPETPVTPTGAKEHDPMEVDKASGTADKSAPEPMNEDSAFPSALSKEPATSSSSPTEEATAPTSPSPPAANKKKPAEKFGYQLPNMSRVSPAQLRYICFDHTGRYQPVRRPTGGVTLLHDSKPDTEKALVQFKSKRAVPAAAATAAALVPAPAPAATVLTSTSGMSVGARVGASRSYSAAQTGAGAAGVGLASGAAAAAAILNAIDEDGEGAQEAPVPEGFEYETDGEGGEGEEEESSAGESEGSEGGEGMGEI